MQDIWRPRSGRRFLHRTCGVFGEEVELLSVVVEVADSDRAVSCGLGMLDEVIAVEQV